MDIVRFNALVSTLAQQNGESPPLLQGQTEDGLLYLACFDEGGQGVSTLITSTGVGDNKVITYDPEPVVSEQCGTPATRIAALPAQYAWVVRATPQNRTASRRPYTHVTVTSGLDMAISRTNPSAPHFELVTCLLSDGKRSAYLGDLAVHPFQNFAG